MQQTARQQLTPLGRSRGSIPEERWYLRALRQYSVPMLRVALGIVFVWFGALKAAGVSPVGDLVADTVPWLDRGLVVPLLGAFEVALGLVLISGRFILWACAAMVAHLCGTFLVYVTQPDVAFQQGNPLLMTTEGEFVAKNMVLIAAGLVVAAVSLQRHGRAVS
jgi:putative oxidoreductase